MLQSGETENRSMIWFPLVTGVASETDSVLELLGMVDVWTAPGTRCTRPGFRRQTRSAAER